MKFLDRIISRAKQNVKTIVLAEGFDRRTLEAAAQIGKQGFANIVILGKVEDVEIKGSDLDLSKATIIDHLNHQNLAIYAQQFYEMRKNKGMTVDKALETVKNPLYYGAMMVKNNEVDGMVAGASNSTADTIRCALQTVKTAPGVSIFSTCTILVMPDQNYGDDGVCIFTDTAMFDNPNSEELAQIGISAAEFTQALNGSVPKVAFLSYSSHGSASGVSPAKVLAATNLAKEKAPQFIIDGELQFDSAVVPQIAQLKAAASPLKGEANVLVFPDLDSANIGCKIAERFGGGELYGPVSQGLARPINDLSRGCSPRDIVGMVAITALQAAALDNK